MEIFAFNENAVGYENKSADPQLRSFNDINLEISKSAIMGVASVAAATAVVSSAPEAQAVVGPGDVCPAVSDVQRALNNAGFNAGSVDGDYGTQTTTAVRNFQLQQGLSADGVVGPTTADALGLEDADNPNSPFLPGNGCGAGSTQEVSGTVTASSGLIVRSGPGTGFSNVGNFANGSTVVFDPTSRTNNGGFTWVRVTEGPLAGRWIAEDFLGTSGSGTGQEVSGTVSANSGLTVRTGPGLGFGSVGRFDSGATVFYDPTTRTSRDGYTWVEVTSGVYDGQWIAEDFLGDDSGSSQEVSGSVTANSGLTIRTGPGTGFGSVGSFSSGTTVFYDPTSRTNQGGFTWVEIISGPFAGRWVAEDFLGTGESGTGQEVSNTVAANSGLTIRTGPGTDFDAVGSFAPDATVFFDPTTRTDSGGFTWVRITTGDFTGRWIAEDFLS